MRIKCISIEPLKEKWLNHVEKKCGVHIELVTRESWQNHRDKIQGCELLICRDRDLSEEFLDEFKSLQYIFIVSAGVEKLPFEYLKNRNISVINSGGASDSAMSDYVIGAMLMFSSRFKECIEYKMQEHWQKFLMTESLKGKKLIVVGAGKIGRAIARKAKVMEMVTFGVKRTKSKLPEFDEVYSLDELESILPNADYVACTIPLTEETLYLFNETRFSCMNSNAVFINISRGKIVNEDDLIHALENGKIKAAVLDVFEIEPLPKDSKLWKLDNVVITPHSSGRINDFLGRSMEIFAENMCYLLRNEEVPNLVDLDKKY